MNRKLKVGDLVVPIREDPSFGAWRHSRKDHLNRVCEITGVGGSELLPDQYQLRNLGQIASTWWWTYSELFPLPKNMSRDQIQALKGILS